MNEQERFSRLIMQPFDVSNWPNTATPCWFAAPRLIAYNGRPSTPRRVFFAIMLGQPLHPSWILKPSCGGPACCNPHHMMPEIQFGHAAGIEPLPDSIMMMLAGIAMGADAPEDETEDCAEMILMIEDGRNMPASHFVERFAGAYDLATCERALAKIQERGE